MVATLHLCSTQLDAQNNDDGPSRCSVDDGRLLDFNVASLNVSHGSDMSEELV